MLLLINKPVYPLYLWFLAPSALLPSLLTMLSMPAYWLIARLAKRAPDLARKGLVLAGLLDTVAISFVLGQASGAEFFLFACMLLASLCFYRDETLASRLSVVAIFCVFAVLHGRYGSGLGQIMPDDAANLFKLNLLGAAALIAFMALRFPRSARRPRVRS
ncbi:hypothetical protein [Martelella sp. HB161492]|uniref:hypothetical protein n=1 Tax=Martelella sp. HB161492 TaxID=2720726 RepID=UPI0015926EDB|nr:hypothetical protein [Martelella sp. HB161492]